MTAALHATKLRQLWSKFSDSIYSSLNEQYASVPSTLPMSIESLRQELEEWKAAIPRCDTEDSSSGKALSVFASQKWFQLAYDYSILLLYRHYIIGRSAARRDAFSPASVRTMDARDRAFEICADHARDICLIYRHLYQTQGAHVQFTWGSLHILFLAGLTYLYCLWRSPCVRQKARPTTVMNTSMACTTVLIIIADRWPSAISYRDIFETLSERTISMMCGEKGAIAQDVRLFNSADSVPSANFHPTGDSVFNPSDGAINPSASEDLDPTNDAFTNLGSMEGTVPLQDWIMGLGNIEAPGDSQWLAQELFDGMRY